MSHLTIGQVADDWPYLGTVTIVAMRRVGQPQDHKAEFVLRDEAGVEHTQTWIGAAHLVPPSHEQTTKGAAAE